MTHPFTVGGVPMQLPIMLGGGVCKFVHQLEPYLRSDLPVGALEIGSFTPDERPGNPGSPQWPESLEDFRRYGLGLNSWNMPNAGFEATAAALATIESPHPIIANIAGFAPTDFVDGVKIFEALPQVAGTTLNFGCPNTESIPIACSLNSTKAIMDAVQQTQPEKPVWIKLSPPITEEERDKLAEKLAKIVHPLLVDLSEVPTTPAGFLAEMLGLILPYSFVKAAIIANTLGNVRIIDPNTGQLVIKVNNGKGGLSGSFLRDNITLPLVKQASDFLNGRLDIIACGGGDEGKRIVDYLHTGAKGVQCVSGPIWNSGPQFFASLLEDPNLQQYLTERM